MKNEAEKILPSKFSDYPLDVTAVSVLLSFHPQYVRYLAKKGKIPGVKILGKWRFSEKELTEHLIKFENSPVINSQEDNLLS